MKRRLALLACLILWARLAGGAQPRQPDLGVRADIARALDKAARIHRGFIRKPASAPIPSFGTTAPAASGIGYLNAAMVDAGGISSYSQIAADFNADGNQDTATIVGNGDGVTFWIAVDLGQGNGTFATPVLTPVSFSTGDRLYAADVNSDGKSDLVLVHVGSFDVFMGNGDGTFAAASNYSDGVDSLSAVSVCDVNSDGAPDVVVLSAGGATPMVSTVLNLGNGTFGSPTLVPFPAQVPNAVFADLNGDGKLDVISSLEVFLADPTSGYQAGVALGNAHNSGMCGGNNGALAVADLNADSLLDIVSADCEYDTVTVFLNTGSGVFQAGTSVWAGFFPQAISIADMNGDGIPDIVAANAYSSDVTVLTGGGDGTFQPASVGYSVGGLAYGLPAVSDFNNDGAADVLVSNFVSDQNFAAAYLQGFGDGSFISARDYFSPPPSPVLSGEFGLGLASADFNGDGRPDFVLGNSGSTNEGVTVFLTNSNGSMQAGVNYGVGGSLNFVGTGDFNGDGQQDIVAADSTSGALNLFHGNGDGTFQSPQMFPAVSGAEGLAVGDFNHDGKPDVAVMGFSLAVLLNDGNGGFLPAANYAAITNSSLVTAADVNGDGKLDLILPKIGGNSLYLLLGRADGTFQSAPDIALGHSNPAGVTVGDFNGDGNLDVAATIEDFSGMGIAVALGNGDGSFQSAVLYPCTTHNLDSEQPYPNGIIAVDVEHDGKLDLVYSQLQSGLIGILYGNADGTFKSPVEFPAGAYPYQIVAADVNGDGAQDAIASGGLFSGITVLLNAGGINVTLTSSPNPANAGQLITLTATVTPTVAGMSAVPTGTISFSDGSTVLGTAPVVAGHATLSVSTLASGNHNLAAAYSGSGSYIPSVSSTVTQVVIGTPSFTLSATPTLVTLQRGSSSNFTVTVTPANGYSGTVTFACGSLPNGVTCQFQPASVAVSGAPVTARLTISAASTAAAAAPVRFNGLLLWSTGTFGFVLVNGVSRRRWMIALIAVLALVAMLSLVGCGSGSGSVSPIASTPGNPTLSSVQVMASGPAPNGGTMTQQLTIRLNMN